MIAMTVCAVIVTACGEVPQVTPEATAVLPTLPPAAVVSPGAETPSSGQVDCVDDAAFVADLTLPDASSAVPGSQLTKQWSVQNTGTCDWGPDYRLVAILPNPLAGKEPIALYPAKAGTQAVWQVTVNVPDMEGEVIGRWQAQNPDGTAFGQEVYVVLEVSQPAATEPAASPTP